MKICFKKLLIILTSHTCHFGRFFVKKRLMITQMYRFLLLTGMHYLVEHNKDRCIFI